MKKLLVLGAGLIGIRHIRHIEQAENCELVGVVEPNATVAANIDAKVFASIDDVDTEVDGAIIATPNFVHLSNYRDVVKRGWHALIEKPVADTLEQADEMVEIDRASSVKALVGHHRRYHHNVAQLKQVLNSGLIGKPILANVIWAVKKPDEYFEGNWREGPHGSPILINMVHDIDLLRYVIGEISNVSGLGANPVRNTERIESGVIALGFENGCTGAITFADTSPSPWGFEAGTGENPNIGFTGQDMIRICGTKGAVSYPSMRIWSGAENWGQSAKSETLKSEKSVPLVNQLQHFCDVIDGKVEPLISVEDARRNLQIALMAHQAIVDGSKAQTTGQETSDHNAPGVV